MRLATKLALAVVLIMAVVFSLRAYDSAQREIARVRSDLREGHFIIGRALRPAILEVWRLEGKKRALEVLGYADERIQRARQVRIEWVPLDPPSARHLALIGATEVAQMKRQVDATIVRIDQDKLKTYIPLVHLGQLEGALEISEPLTPHEERSRAEVRAVMVRAGLGAAVSIAAVSAFGFLLIGRPDAAPERDGQAHRYRRPAGPAEAAAARRDRPAGERDEPDVRPAAGGQRAGRRGDGGPHRRAGAAAPRRSPAHGRDAGLGHRPRAGHAAERGVGAGQDGGHRGGRRARTRRRAAGSSSTRWSASPRSSASCWTSPAGAPPTGAATCWRRWWSRR